MKKIDKKRVITVIILVVITLISIFGVSKIASSNEFHTKSIQALDEKKVVVLELTAEMRQHH